MNTTKTVVSIFNLAPRRIGGIETMAREVSRQLAELGWQSVLCFRSAPPEPVRDFLNLANVKLEVIEDLSRWSVRCHGRLLSLLRRYQPEVLHLNFVDLFGPYAALAKVRGVSRIYFTDHISRPEAYLPRRSGLAKRIAYRLALPITRVFCVSNFVRECWLNTGRMPSHRFVTVYNGVDMARCEASLCQRARFRAAYSISEETIVVTQISSMTHEKGCSTFLEAARHVLKLAPRTLFLLAGDGKHLHDFQLLSQQLQLGDRIKFLGLVEDPVGEGLFAGSDIVCQASNWQEAFGLSIAEAMACRRPVVATHVGGIPELVQEGRTGFLVERGDVSGLAAGILKLAAPGSLRQQFGEEARQFCGQHFDHRANAGRMIQMYGLSAVRPTAFGSVSS